jgi:hypothetical protein
VFHCFEWGKKEKETTKQERKINKKYNKDKIDKYTKVPQKVIGNV